MIVIFVDNMMIMEKKKKISLPALLLLIACAVFSGGAGGAYVALTSDLPQIRSLENFQPSAVTRIYSADKVLLTELFAEKRDPVPLKQLPPMLTQALLSIEDNNFYSHIGVDIKGLARAMVANVLAMGYKQGGSTLTQQLAKTLFLTRRKTLTRKLKEAVLAVQLERRYTKDEILEFYFNQVYFGSGAYGVESASRTYFGKPVTELSLAECALLAGMPKAPSTYSPRVNMKRALKRRNIVLAQMKKYKIISPEEYKASKNTEIVLAKSANSTRAPYFIEHVKKTLEEQIDSSRLYKEGLTIYTTLRWNIQQTAEKAISDGIAALEKRMKRNGIKSDDHQSAVVSIDVRTGAIIAMVGGRDFKESPFNRATMAKRQPGSAFKPILFALAVERGFPQNMLLLDAPVAYKGGKDGKDWTPTNYSKTYEGEMTLRKALAKSKNIPAVRLIEKIGPVSVANFAAKLGIRSRLNPNLSLSLGTSEVSLLEITAAYAVFANQGEYVEPFCVTEARDRSGRVIWKATRNKRIAMTREDAAVITNMLEAVVTEGTGKRARSISASLGGKTGTTNFFKDALFVGFSPRTATGVWTGRDKFETLGPFETGAKAALPIWIDVMKKAVEDRPRQYFDLPESLVKVRIDSTTGKIVKSNAPNASEALFKKGTEPKTY